MGTNNSKLKRKKSKSKRVPISSEKSGKEDKEDKEEEIKYYLANDIKDIDREHMYHFFKRYLFGNNFSSPIEEKLVQGCKVLDVGCGPGTWLLDVSGTYPNAQFFGLDMKSIFPQEIKPYNLEFIEANIFDGLPFPDNEFDYTHMEQMGLIFTREQWDYAISELIRVTKLGGYIEIIEPYGIVDESGPIIKRIDEGTYNSCLKRNVDMKLVSDLDTIIETHSNISKVHREERMTIVGQNGGKIGSVYQNIYLLFLNMAIKALSNELGISEEEFKNLLENDVIEEFNHVKHAVNYVRFWTQKV